MSSGYYEAGPKRSERVRQLFSRIARRYDLINDLQSGGMHRLWKRRMVKESGAQGQIALDVCCGTGDIAERLAAKMGTVVACDFTPEMLEGGRSRAVENVTWVQADALALPFQSESFEVVTVAYGLRNLADVEAGISELLRVLRPGGRLLILDFGKPSNRILRAAYFTYLKAVVPIFGLVFCGDSAAYSYILDSLHQYPAQEGVTKMLRGAGCEDIRVVNFLGGAMSLHVAIRGRNSGDVKAPDGERTVYLARATI